MKFEIPRTRYGKLKNSLEVNLLNKTVGPNEIQMILTLVEQYQKDNIDTIKKLNRSKKIDLKKINGALKQTINAHSIITKELIGSASKRIYGALLVNEKSKKEKFYEKISSIYHTFVNSLIFIIKLLFMEENKSKISVTISKVNDKKLNDKSINKSKLIDKLLTDYFKNGEK